MAGERGTAARKFIEDMYREYWQARGKAYLEKRDAEGEFLEGHAIHSLHVPESRLGIPGSVLEAYDFYNKHCDNWGGATVYQVDIEGQPTYVVRVMTDGDDGWVELFDEAGNSLGGARTYIELVAWGHVGIIRNYVFSGKFPDELKDRHLKTLWVKVGEQKAKLINLIRIVVDLREEESARFLKIFNRVKERHRFTSEEEVLKELAGLRPRRHIIDSDLAE